MKPFIYSVFDFTVESEIEFLELAKSDSKPEVQIKYGKVPFTLGNNSYKGVTYEAVPGALLLKVPKVANYLIANGNNITIDPSPNVEESTIKLFVLGSAIGALLHQRGILALHSSAIAFGNNAFLICGTSGAGKSTLAAKLISKGFSILTDDVTAIGFIDDNPVVLPGINVLKLWKDSLLKLNLNPENLTKVRKEMEKFYVPVDMERTETKCLLQKAYIMYSSNLDEITLTPVNGLDKFTVLKNHTYRFNFVKGMGMEKIHFDLVGRLASKIRISRLSRFKKSFDLEKLADIVSCDFKNEKNAR